MIPTSPIACAHGGTRSSNLLSRSSLAGMLLALQRHGGAFRSGLRDLDGYIIGMFVATVLLISTFARRLPGFLA